MALGDTLVHAEAVFGRIAAPLNAAVIALVILLSGFILGRIVDRLLFRLLPLARFDDACARLFGAQRNYSRATRRTVVFLMYCATVYFTLSRLGIAKATLLVLLGLLVLIVLGSVLLAASEMLPGLRSRSMLKKRGIGEGDIVRIDDPSGHLTGRVAGLTLTEIRLRRGNGDLIFYPLVALRSVRITKKSAARP